MTSIETLRQTVQDCVQQVYNEGEFVNQELVHEVAMGEFEVAGGAEAFDIDEDEIFDFLVDEIIAGMTIRF